jgi:hypothetical protein
MATPILALTELVAAQSQPHVPINMAFRRIEASVQLVVIAQEVNPPGMPAEGDRYIVSTCGAGAWSDHDGEVAFYSGTAWEFLVPQEGWVVFDQDEDRYIRCSGGSPLTWGSAYFIDVDIFTPGIPTNSQLMHKRIAARTMTFPANFAGSYGHLSANPTAVTALDVRIAGASVGTISISTGGVFTFTTSGGTAKTATAGQRIEIVNQASADATAANIAATLVAGI